MSAPPPCAIGRAPVTGSPRRTAGSVPRFSPAVPPGRSEHNSRPRQVIFHCGGAAAVFRVDGIAHALRPGQMIQVNPWQDHEKLANPDGASVLLSVLFDPAAAGGDSPARVGDLPALSGMSRSHFFRQFRRCLGVSPHDIIDYVQITAAIQRLSSRGQPIGAIARDLGFTTSSHFARFFADTSERRRSAIGVRRSLCEGRRGLWPEGRRVSPPLSSPCPFTSPRTATHTAVRTPRPPSPSAPA
jgi:AraC-like DNA-binding protein